MSKRIPNWIGATFSNSCSAAKDPQTTQIAFYRSPRRERHKRRMPASSPATERAGHVQEILASVPFIEPPQDRVIGLTRPR